MIRIEQQRLVYRVYLKTKFGRNWKRQAPVEVLMPLRLARFGVPLAETVPAALQSVGLPVPDLFVTGQAPQLTPGTSPGQAPELAPHGTAVEASAEASERVEEHDATAGALSRHSSRTYSRSWRPSRPTTVSARRPSRHA